MKKLLIIVGGVMVLLIAALFVVSSLDFNRMGKSTAYVQITAEGTVEEWKTNTGEVMKTYWYEYRAYDEKGSEQVLKFSSQKNLRTGAYLKLYIKNGAEVTSYDEVQLEDIPQKAADKLK